MDEAVFVGNVCRPVLILGPLADALINKITSESPDKYCRCETGSCHVQASSLFWRLNSPSTSHLIITHQI